MSPQLPFYDEYLLGLKLYFMVFMKPSQVVQLYRQWQARNLDFIPFGFFDPELKSCLQGGKGCWQDTCPNTQLLVVNFSKAIQYSCNYPGKHI